MAMKRAMKQGHDAESTKKGFGPYEVADNKVYSDLFDIPIYLSLRDCKDVQASLADAIAQQPHMSHTYTLYKSEVSSIARYSKNLHEKNSGAACAAGSS